MSTPVPLIDLKAQYNTIRDEIEPVLKDVVESQWFILGPEVAALEEEIAAYCQCDHAISCSSGSDALILALMALDIGPGDQVICPSFTYYATTGSISMTGATPVFVDIDPETYNIDIDHLRSVAASCTSLKAIMPVHLFGQCVDMDGVLEVAAELGVPVVEDAAQAIGARDVTGAAAGSRGDIGCFSFFPTKNLGCFGDGGIITTNDEKIAEKLRILRVHGSSKRYHHELLGMNGRLDAIQAAVLRVKLRHLQSWHEGRRANAARYDAAFTAAGAGTSELPIELPVRVGGDAWHIFNQYTLRIGNGLRDELWDHLKSLKIGAEVYYPIPVHLQPCYAFLGGSEGDLPVTETAAAEVLSLPIYPELTTDQIDTVAEAIISWVQSHAPVA